jgi:hypothetical protein
VVVPGLDDARARFGERPEHVVGLMRVGAVRSTGGIGAGMKVNDAPRSGGTDRRTSHVVPFLTHIRSNESGGDVCLVMQLVNTSDDTRAGGSRNERSAQASASTGLSSGPERGKRCR